MARAIALPGVGVWVRFHEGRSETRPGQRFYRFPHEDSGAYFGPVEIEVDLDPAHKAAGDHPFRTLSPIPSPVCWTGDKRPATILEGWIRSDLFRLISP